MPPARRKSVTRVIAACVALFVVSVLGSLGMTYLAQSDPAFAAGEGTLWLIGAIALLLMIGSLAVGALWMRSIDEAAREAHKAAWYWGGSSGMAVGGVLMIVATLPGAERWVFPAVLDGRTDPAVYAAAGGFGMMMLMIIGYTIVWAWWWLARR